jgi:putative heme-binding domain-containing protein
MSYLVRLSLCLTVAGLMPIAAPAAETPHWIWGANPKAQETELSRKFTLPDGVQRAAIRMAADFCTAAVIVNEETALVVEPYCQTQDLDVTKWIRRGENEIVIVGDAVPGPPAVALSLNVLHKDGRVEGIVTDDRWRSTDSKKLLGAADLGPVRPELWGIGRRPATVSPFENYEQWRQTLDKKTGPQTKFDTPPGFTVTTLRNAAEDEGSWIAMAFDPQGRLIVSREDKGLLRMTIAADRRSVTRVEPIDVDLKECRGLVFDGEYLLANANNSKAMYRLRLAEDGKAADLERLREFPGEVGHGRNDLALGPNGVLYSIHGDAVKPPGEPILDRTSPLRESRQGPPRKEAYLLKTDPRGKSWELVCTGLRNPYGVAVHPNGDVFTYDADNEFDMGTPWYRPTRIVQLLSGADFGYRAAGGQWPPRFPDRPDNGLPVIDVGRGSPTAAMFGTDLKFPSEYRAAMYALDWSYGRVLAVHLAPRGGGYRAALEVFLQGRPLNVTDVAAGPDGAMYLITGGRKTQSALYRVEFTGKIEPPPAESQHERDCAKFAAVQRKIRQQLEKFHGVADHADDVVELALKHLGDADPTVRYAARVIAEQTNDSPDVMALGYIDDARAQTAMRVALARVNDADLALKLSALLVPPRPEDGIDDRFEALFLLQRCFAQSPETASDRNRWMPDAILDAIESARGAPRQVGVYGDSDEFVRRAALFLGELGAPEAVTAAAPLLDDEKQENRLLALLALRNQTAGWTPEIRRRYFETLRDGVRFVGGQGMPEFLDKLKTDAVATLSEQEKDQFADLLKPAAIADEPLPPPRKKLQEWKLEDLSPAYADGGTAGDAKRGETIFRDALCSRCHRSGLTGPAVGPDLTFVARRFSRRDMLDSILAPSRAVAEQYRNAQVTTVDGHVHTGRVLTEGDFRSEKLRLNTDPLRPGKVVEVDKKEIEEYRLTDTSPMPQGLLDSFTLDDVRDLLAYLESGATQ